MVGRGQSFPGCSRQLGGGRHVESRSEGDRNRFGGGVKPLESCHLLPSNKAVPCSASSRIRLCRVPFRQWPCAPSPRPSQPFLADSALTTLPTCKVSSFPLMRGRAEEGRGGLGSEASWGVGCSEAGASRGGQAGDWLWSRISLLGPTAGAVQGIAHAQLEPRPQTSTEPGCVRCC